MAYLLGYDVGSSSIKASLLEADSGAVVASAVSPGTEMEINAPRPGWAEQRPEVWWEHVKAATAEVRSKANVNARDIKAVGISYQMHGLVMVDEHLRVLRPAIIWCDSRAVDIGERAFADIGPEICLEHCLNSPGNFTASKLKWVKDNEPEIFRRIYKVMLPGDYIGMAMTGEIRTTVSGLSEAIVWDFREGRPADRILDYFGLSAGLFPEVVDTFAVQGELTVPAAAELGLSPGTPVAYRAGDQPNNAFSLNVLEPGELAATAGTSGVVYGVGDKPDYDPKSRVNVFVHVNHSREQPRYGTLLCVSGTGSLNRWLRDLLATGGKAPSYDAMNEAASSAPVGAGGLVVLPYGNGAERTLCNRNPGALIHGLDFNYHGLSHLLRASQEGIVFALHYGLEIMRGIGIKIDTVKAGHANMFLSPLFRRTFAAVTGAHVELYNTDGSQGAARGAGVGAGIYPDFASAFRGLERVETVEPDEDLIAPCREAYERWLGVMERETGIK